MGLLDGFSPGGWGGLLNTPIDWPPGQRPAPLFVPPTDSAGGAGDNPYPLAIASPSAGAMPATTGDAGRGQSASPGGGAQPPQWPAPNLTMQALCVKGVPDAHIAAAFDNPALMRQLINRNFGPASAAANAPPDPVGFGVDGQRDAWADDDPRRLMNPMGSLAGGPPGINVPNQTRNGVSAALLGTPFDTRQTSPDPNAPGSALVQLAQYAPARPALPMPPGPFSPGTPAGKEWADGFIKSNGRAVREIGDWIRGIFHNGQNDENDDNEENAVRPPAGSRPINETPWSGDHTEIKRAVRAGATTNVKISPRGDVWAQHPDGSWTNHGSAEQFTGSGKPGGRRGKDRDRW
jgi:hypothetical protein